jgi:DNA-binding CsgD family transcriptional regulator
VLDSTIPLQDSVKILNTMTEQLKSNEQLHSEIQHLRRENQALAAQLTFHRKVFREVHLALGVAGELSETVQSSELMQQLVTENEQLKNQLKLLRLSEREKEILKLILCGYTSKEIASQLNISKLTVDTHRKHIQQKLEVSNVVELLKMAMQLDLG